MIKEAFQLCLRVYGPENDHSKSMRKLYSNAKARYGPKTAKIVGLFFAAAIPRLYYCYKRVYV